MSTYRQPPKDNDLPLFAPKPAWDITRNFHEGSDASTEAFKRNREHLTGVRAEVYAFVASRGAEGATIDEATIGLRKPWQTVGARISELVADGDIVRLAKMRDTSRGNPSHVHVTLRVWEQMGQPPAAVRRGSRRTTS